MGPLVLILRKKTKFDTILGFPNTSDTLFAIYPIFNDTRVDSHVFLALRTHWWDLFNMMLHGFDSSSSEFEDLSEPRLSSTKFEYFSKPSLLHSKGIFSNLLFY